MQVRYADSSSPYHVVHQQHLELKPGVALRTDGLPSGAVKLLTLKAYRPTRRRRTAVGPWCSPLTLTARRPSSGRCKTTAHLVQAKAPAASFATLVQHNVTRKEMRPGP
jgi:hypothetical protein